MEDSQVETFRQRLLREREELLALDRDGEESRRPVALDQSSVGRLSRMDAMQSQAMARENARRRKLQLTRIEAALERIEEGEYGWCASCDEAINPKRLEVDPAAPFCIDCAKSL